MANLNWALGICGEAGEYSEIIKKHTFHGKAMDIHHAKRELGDVLYYVAMAARNLGLDLGDIAQDNVDNLRERYPNGFQKGGGIRHESADTKEARFREAFRKRRVIKNNDHEDDGN